MPILRRREGVPPTQFEGSTQTGATDVLSNQTGVLSPVTSQMRTAPMATPQPTTVSRADGQTALAQLRQRLHSKIVVDLRDSVDLSDDMVVRRDIDRLFNLYLSEEDLVLNRTQRAKLQNQVIAEILGYGPIQELINDDNITEIMVNGPADVWIEQNGRLTLTEINFQDNEHVMRIINRIVAPLGRHVDEASPMVDARLPDGSRVNVIIPPLSLAGPAISIRKFSKVPYTADDLIRFGTIADKAVIFLEAAVKAGLNIIVAGGTSSGKTTFLNILSSFIPGDERIITIEDAAELQLQQRHVLPLESRPANIEGAGQIGIRELVVNSLRMRPDRVIVGECRGKEALDMLQAMNTGHDGCMTTIHSNGARDTLSRIETMVLMAGADLPLRAIREQVASAFDLVVYMERLADGSRKVTNISEILGMEEETILMQSIFQLEYFEQDGRKIQEMRPQGLRPGVMRKLERANHYMPADFFEARHIVHDPSRGQ
jgi:pilus assembly protein CpaF